MTKEQVIAEAMSLNEGDRLEVANSILHSVAVEDDDLTPEEIAEIDRRLEECRKNPDSCAPWEEAFERLRRRTP